MLMIDHNGKNGGNNFLFVAHPGHELCVHAWLTSTRPKVFVLTDGSGHGTQPRIGSTNKLLERAGAERGPIYARFADAELYELILNRDFYSRVRCTRRRCGAASATHIPP